MTKRFFFPAIASLSFLVGVSTARAGDEVYSGPDSFPWRASSAAALDNKCPASHPLYCAAVDRCCPSGMGYYCTNWQSLPDPSPLSERLKGPCLNIKRFSEGQVYYLEKYCDPHGCG